MKAFIGRLMWLAGIFLHCVASEYGVRELGLMSCEPNAAAAAAATPCCWPADDGFIAARPDAGCCCCGCGTLR